MSTKSAKAVKEWRKNTKLKLVTCMGSKCQICNYDKCTEALEFHHIDPQEKDFSMGAIRANPKNWKKICEELSKCILLCSNCHREIHAEVIELPVTYQTFDESFLYLESNEHLLKQTKTSYCPVCNKTKMNVNLTCSKECASKRRLKINWSKINLIDLIDNQKRTKISIAEELGCSDVLVGKRYNSLKKVSSTN